ncbi:hypothetical protein OAG68_01980 [bacterium]|nr:hypothetical protein [bacterium]
MNEKLMGSPALLKTTNYDRVNSFLHSALVVCALVVCGLFAMWMVGDYQPAPPDGGGMTVPYPLPPDQQIEDFAEDFVEDDIERRSFEDLLKNVSATTSELSEVIAGGMDGLDGVNTTRRRGKPIPPLEGSVQNWEIYYEVDSIEKYAKQLDFFGIELGAVSLADNRIIRVGQLSGDRTRLDSSRSQEQETAYFAHKQRKLKVWDRALLRGQKLNFDFEVVHLFPEQITAQMGKAELNYLSSQTRKLSEVKLTRFELVPDGDGWKIRVAMMEFAESGKVQ